MDERPDTPPAGSLPEPQTPETPHEAADDHLVLPEAYQATRGVFGAPAAATPPPRDPAWSYYDIVLMLASAVPCATLAAMLTYGVAWIMHVKLNTKIMGLPIEFLTYVIWFSWMAAWLRMRYGLRFWRALGWRLHGDDIFPAISGGVVLSIALIALGTALHPPVTENEITELLKNPVTRAMLALAATTVGPICEELLFRGFIQPVLIRSCGAVAGIILTNVPFALLHGAQYKWVWQTVVIVFLAGCVFGWVRLKTRSTATSAIVHATYNTVPFIVMLVRGGVDF